jgi:hypothetical protein
MSVIEQLMRVMMVVMMIDLEDTDLPEFSSNGNETMIAVNVIHMDVKDI